MKFGNVCKDLVTGFEGIMTSRTAFITGCDRVELKPTDVEKESKTFDLGMVRFVSDGIANEISNANKFEDLDRALYNFGDEAMDKITEFKGRITGKFISVTGDIAYGVSPKFSAMNRENDAQWFDEGRIEIIEEKVVEVDINKTRVGGVVPKFKYR